MKKVFCLFVAIGMLFGAAAWADQDPNSDPGDVVTTNFICTDSNDMQTAMSFLAEIEGDSNGNQQISQLFAFLQSPESVCYHGSLGHFGGASGISVTLVEWQGQIETAAYGPYPATTHHIWQAKDPVGKTVWTFTWEAHEEPKAGDDA